MPGNFISYLTANKNKALVLLNLFFFLSMTMFIGYAFSKNRYMVVEEDEAIYYNSARLFSETGSVRAFDCFDENTSKIGSTCWYGPMYHLLHGGIAKVVGLHKYNFLVFNLFCLALILLLAYISGFTYTNKLLLSLGFLTSVPCLYYLFSYYPVTLDLLFSTMLILQLKKIYDKDLKGEPVIKTKTIFVALLLFFMLFRVATVFWVFGLLPFAKTKKQFLQTPLLSVGCLFLAILSIYLFNAPYHGNIVPVIFDKPFSLSTYIQFYHTIINNFRNYFTQTPLLFGEYLFLLIISIVSYITTKNKFTLSACIIGITYLLILIPVYTYNPVFLNKLTAPLYPLLLVPIFYAGSSMIKKATVILLLLLSPTLYLETFDQIQNHRWAYTFNNELSHLTKPFQDLKYKLQGGKPIVVEGLYKEFEDTIPYFIQMANLPASTTDGFPITYSNNFPDSTWKKTSYSSHFKKYGRLHIDYILARHPITIDSITFVYSNDLFYLYKNNKQTK